MRERIIIIFIVALGLSILGGFFYSMIMTNEATRMGIYPYMQNIYRSTQYGDKVLSERMGKLEERVTLLEEELDINWEMTWPDTL